MPNIETEPALQVIIACSGIGHINRGFETFAQELFGALLVFPGFSARLFAGAKTSEIGSTSLLCIKRTSGLAQFLARVIRRDPYFVEQFSFALCMLPQLLICPPDVLVASDGALCNILGKFRRIFRFKFRILFSNGGPYSPPYPACDHVHQVLESVYDEGIQHGYLQEQQTLIPYGFLIPESFVPPDAREVAQLRSKLELPPERRIVLTVGAINRSHKRMDHLIEEVGKISEDERPYLLLMGQQDEETEDVFQLAKERLGNEGFEWRCVSANELSEYYRTCDLFVLGSLAEGFGRVIVEALAQGQFCILHDEAFSRGILGSHGLRINLQEEGELAKAITNFLKSPDSPLTKIERNRYAYHQFGWDALLPSYAEMIRRVADAEVIGEFRSLAKAVDHI